MSMEKMCLVEKPANEYYTQNIDQLALRSEPDYIEKERDAAMR